MAMVHGKTHIKILTLVTSGDGRGIRKYRGAVISPCTLCSGWSHFWVFTSTHSCFIIRVLLFVCLFKISFTIFELRFTLIFCLWWTLISVNFIRNFFLHFGPVLGPFKAWQVHGIHTDGKISKEPLGCLACLYSWVGEPRTLQAACLSDCFCMAHVMVLDPQHGTQHGPSPLARVSSSSPPAGNPYLFEY